MAQQHNGLKQLLAATVCATGLGSTGATAVDNGGEWSCVADASGQWNCTPVASQESKYSSPAPLSQRVGRRESNRLLHPGSRLDWYPREQLTSEQLAAVSPQCDGAYIEPPNTSPSAGTAFDLADMSASAGETELRGNNVAVFTGGVEIAKGNIRVRADKAVVDKAAETLTLEGDVIFRDTGKLLLGERADIQLGTGTGQVHRVTYVLHDKHSRGKADLVDRHSEHITVITDGTYTHCAPDSNAWSLRASKIVLDDESGMGTATNARVRIKDVPVLYSPWLTFPIDDRRRTGLLWPSLSTADNPEGYDITVPLYLNIAPNWDATVAGRQITDRGTMGEGEVRHLNRYSDWAVSGAWIEDDVYEEERWLTSVQENGGFGGNWWHRIDYTEVSDRDYLNDLSSDSLDVKRETHLKQTGAAGYYGENWRFSSEVTDFQTLRFQDITENLVKPYTLLPQVELQTRRFDRPFELQWSLFTQATGFDSEENRPRGTRVYAEPGISYPMEWVAGYIKPTAKVRSVNYSLDDGNPLPNPDEDDPATTAPMASLDGGLFFERDMRWLDTGYVQTLEPRVYYLYSAREDQADQPLFDTTTMIFDYDQLFRESRFSGFDRIDDANQVTAGVTTRFLQDNTGRETLSASIGQIVYFEDREVNVQRNEVESDSSSEFAGQLTWRPLDSLYSETNMSWQPDSGRVERGVGMLRYHSPAHTIVNLGYRYERRPENFENGGERIDNDINESEMSAIIPLTPNWAIIGQLQYDHTNERDIEQTLGFEYDSCCWLVRMVYQQGVDGENRSQSSVYLQVELKGLGGSGNRVYNILDDAIIGFREREDAKI